MQFAYSAIGKSGRIVKGSIPAASVHMLREKLQQQGLSLLDYRRDLFAELRGTGRASRLGRRVLIDLFGYLKGLAAMGMDLQSSWKSLEDSIDDTRAKEVISKIRESIQQGHSLADAMEKTEAFTMIVLGNVRAGETSGSLEKVYGSLEEHYREEQELAQQVYKATLYPLISLVVLFFIGVGLLTFVVPQLKDVFPPDPPWPTALLVFLSDGVVDFWWTPPALVVAAWFGWGKLPEKHKARAMEWVYRLPVVGPLGKNLALCNVFFNLAMMLGAGVSLTSSLALVIPTISSRAMRQKLQLVADITARGGMFSDGFKDPFFPSVVGAALRQGELTGSLDMYLTRLGRFLRDRARARLHTLATFVEPLLLLVGGSMLMFLAIAIFLPIYGQMKNIGR